MRALRACAALARLPLLIALTCSTQVSAQAPVDLAAGWNLLGNSGDAQIAVAPAFGELTQVTTVWKWNRAAGRWMFHAPSLNGADLATYAQNRGYDVLTGIDRKEGFWVHSNAASSVVVPAGAPVTLAASDLQEGWNLVGSADGRTPSELNQSIGQGLAAAGRAMISAWAWDTATGKWKFFAPRLEAEGGSALADYIAVSGYAAFAGPLTAREGFWLDIGPAAATHTLSGTVQVGAAALAGVSFAATGSGASCTVSDAAGHYSCSVPQGYTGSVMPSLAGFSFTPVSRSYSDVRASAAAHDFAATAGPQLAAGIAGTLELVVHDPVDLPRIDGLAFDRFGNLFGVLEVVSSQGGAVYIDKATGAVTPIALNIPGACQLDVHPNGDLYVSSELPIRTVGGVPIQFGGLFRVVVAYDGANRPVSGVATKLPTVLDSPEGVQALHADGAYGSAGQMFVAEDKTGGRIVRIAADGSGLTELVGASANLQKPEGLAFGDFNGARTAALYGAEKAGGRVFRIGADGSVETLGNPAAIGGLNGPDNIEFGPDGHLYVGEKYGGRIVRIAADGTHTVVATGFENIEGVAFDPHTGSLYVTEIELSRVWRVRF